MISPQELKNQVDQLGKLIDELEKESFLDPLTGLKNRNAYEKEIQDIFRQLREQGGVVMVLDVDGLKQVNDNKELGGHMAGDLLLRKFAHYLIANTKAEDPKYRFGEKSDEFVTIFLGIPEENIEKKIQSLIDTANKNKVGDPLAPVFSMGYVYVPKDTFLSYDDFFKVADSAMYEAKKLKESTISHVCRAPTPLPASA